MANRFNPILFSAEIMAKRASVNPAGTPLNSSAGMQPWRPPPVPSSAPAQSGIRSYGDMTQGMGGLGKAITAIPMGMGYIANQMRQAAPAQLPTTAPAQTYQDPREYKAQHNPEQANTPFAQPSPAPASPVVSPVQQAAPAQLPAPTGTPHQWPGVEQFKPVVKPPPALLAAPAPQQATAAAPPTAAPAAPRPNPIKEDPNLWTPEAIARSQANASAPRTVSGNNPYMTPAAQGSFNRPQAPALVSGGSSPAAMSQYAGTETAGPIGAPRDAGQMATDDVVAKVRQSIAARPKGVAFNPRAMNTGIRGSV